MSRIRSARVVLAVVLAVLCGLPAAVMADPIPSQITFTTTGSIGTTGINGSPIVSFQGVTDGSLTVGTPFNLGSLVVSPPASGAWPTYNEAPLQINFTINSIDGQPVTTGQTSLAMDGSLYTTLAPDPPQLLASLPIFAPYKGTPPFQQIPPSPIIFQVGSNTLELYPTATEFNLGQAGTEVGPTTIQGEVDVANFYNTPEPSSLFVFAVMSTAALWRVVRRAA